jgi:bacterioferritin B
MMLVSKEILDLLNRQVAMEFGASLQYDVIASHFAAEALPQLSKHFARQATEERAHAHRFMKYIVDAGGRVVLSTISAPQCKFGTAQQAAKLSLDQELAVTKSINSIADLAIKKGDHATHNFLQWFIQEQSEEVASMDQLLKIVERAGEEGLIFVEQFMMGLGKEEKAG